MVTFVTPHKAPKLLLPLHSVLGVEGLKNVSAPLCICIYIIQECHMKKKKYLKPDSQTLPAFSSPLMAGSVRNDGETIIHDGTDPSELGDGDGDDANSKQNPWGSWDEEE